VSGSNKYTPVWIRYFQAAARSPGVHPCVCSCVGGCIEAVSLSAGRRDYGDVVYRRAASSSLKHLDSGHHSACRGITAHAYGTHHCTLYEEVGWSSLSERRDKHFYLFIYKALPGKLPSYISSLLVISVRSTKLGHIIIYHSLYQMLIPNFERPPLDSMHRSPRPQI